MGKDSQLVVPIAPLDVKQRDRIKRWLDWAAPRGKTPLVYSVLKARSDFPPNLRGGKTVVLISDGDETCGGDLADIQKAFSKPGVKLKLVLTRVHTVGFNVQGNQKAQQELKQIAKLGHGRYFTANDGKQLLAALRAAMNSVEFTVHDQTTGKQIAQGSVNGEPVIVPPGKHLVRLVGANAQLVVEAESDELLELSLNEQGDLVAL